MYSKTLFTLFSLFFIFSLSCEKNIFNISETDAKILYVQSEVSGDTPFLYAIDSDGRNRRQVAKLLPPPPSGYIYIKLCGVLNTNTALIRYSLSGKTILQTTSLDGSNTRNTIFSISRDTTSSLESFSPVISPKRDRIVLRYFDSMPGSKLAIMNNDGSNFQNLDFIPRDAISPKWSPDGSMLIFRQNNTSFSIADLSQKTIQTFSSPFTESPFVSYITWFPDGKRLAVSTFSPNQKIVYILSISTGQWKKMIEKTEDFHLPTEVQFSPMKDRLLFHAAPDLNRVIEHIHVADSNLTNIRRLTDGRYWTFQPQWLSTHEGERIVFKSNQGEMELYSIHPDGSNLIQLTPSGDHNSDIDFTILD